MPRKIGWEDETITGSFRDQDEDKYRGVRGETHIIRVMLECVEYRTHFVDDVLDPDKDGEPRGFSKNCSREWDDEEEDYTGDCMGCDKEYDISPKMATGILFLGIRKGRSKKVKLIDPEDAVKWWPFGGDKYRKLSDVAMELSQAEKPKKLSSVELVITCEDETFQKLNINVSQGKRLTTKAHLAEFKERGVKMLEENIAGTTQQDWKRTMKRKKSKKREEEPEDEELDELEQEEEEDEAPKRTKRKKKAKKKVKKKAKRKKKEPEPEEDEEDDEDEVDDEDLDALLDDL